MQKRHRRDSGGRRAAGSRAGKAASGPEGMLDAASRLLGGEDASRLLRGARSELAFLRAVLAAASARVPAPGRALPETRLELAMDELPFALFLVDPAGRFAFVNRAAEIASGHRREELVGRQIKESLAGSGLAEPLAVVVERARSGRAPLEYRVAYDLPSGGHFEMGLTAALAAGAPGHREELDVVVVGRDLHAPCEELRLRARSMLPAEVESDLRARLRQVERQMARSEKLVAIGQMAAGFVHEINNPLGALSGLVQMMQMDSPREGPQAAVLAQMSGELDRIRRIAESLLELARTPEGTGAEAFRAVDLAALARDVLELMQPQLRAARVRAGLESHLSSAQVLGDPDRLRQLLMNLILNAVQAMSPPGETPPRGGRLTVRLLADRVSEEDLPPRPSRAQDLAGRGEDVLVEEAGRRAATEAAPPWREGLELVRLEVEDTGPGIPAEVMPRLFEPFFTTKPPGRGTGLGLSTAQAIARAHGGTISAANAPGGGAVFTVRLPACAARGSEAAGAPPEGK